MVLSELQFKDKVNAIMMLFQASMGYKAGKGLGKFDQGRAEIVEASTQRGRRGLGFVIKGLDDEEIEWEEDAEVEMQELVEWIPSCSQLPPQQDELENWSSIGEVLTAVGSK